MNGYCADVIPRYRQSSGTMTQCGSLVPSCCSGAKGCAGRDQAWNVSDGNHNHYTGPCLDCPGDVDCKHWDTIDDKGTNRLSVCERP